MPITVSGPRTDDSERNVGKNAMKRAVLLACGLLALGACDRERREPWFIYANGNLHCSGGGSSVKPDTEAIEETGELIEKAGELIEKTKQIAEIFQNDSLTKSSPAIDILKNKTLVLRIDGDFGKAAKACADFLAGMKSPSHEPGVRQVAEEPVEEKPRDTESGRQ